MGTWRIEIKDDNDAFHDAPTYELGRIISELASQFLNADWPEVEYTSQPLRDSNGNTVGFITYDTEEDEL